MFNSFDTQALSHSFYDKDKATQHYFDNMEMCSITDGRRESPQKSKSSLITIKTKATY